MPEMQSYISAAEVEAFLTNYEKCFLTLEPDLIVQHYNVPAFGVAPQGMRVTTDRAQLHSDFSKLTSSLKDKKLKSAHRRLIASATHGQTATEVAVVWDLKNDLGELIERMEVTYVLQRQADELKILGVFLTQGQWDHLPPV